MSQPLVSIVMPYYNRADVLKVSVQSILNQTYKNWELLLVDDASTLPVQLEGDAIRDPRIRIIRLFVNQGAGAARNTGMKHAAGRYIAFLDTDDAWLPKKLEKQVAFLEKAPSSVGGCVTECFLVYPHTKKVRGIPIVDFYEQSLSGYQFSAGSTLVFKKTCLKKVGFQSTDLKRLEDWEWQINFSKYYEWRMVSDVLALININTVPNLYKVKESIDIIEKRIVLKEKKDYKKFKISCLQELCFSSYLGKKYFWFLYYLSLLIFTSPWFFSKRLIKRVKGR